MTERLRIRELEAVIGTLKAIEVSQYELEEALDDVEEAFSEGVTVEAAVTTKHLNFITATRFARERFRLDRQRLLPLGGILDDSPLTIERPLSSRSGRKAVAIRTSEIPLIFDPTGSRAMSAFEPTASRGPFLTAFGDRVWIDTFRFLTQTTILSAPPSLGLIPKPVAVFETFGFVTPGMPIILAAGSFWIASNRLVAGRPDNEFAGCKIQGGTIRLSGNLTSSPGSVSATGSWNAEIELTLDPPGADPAPADVRLPASVRLTLGAAGLGRIDFSDCRLAAYGTSLDLTRNQNAPFFDDSTRTVVIPANASLPRFDFANMQSSLFKVETSGTIFGAGWALPTVVTAPDKLGPANGAGFLWIGIDPGLKAKWSGLEQSALNAKTVLLAAPGSLLLVTTLQEAVSQSLFLWNDSGSPEPRRCSLGFDAPVGAVLFYFVGSNIESFLVFGAVQGHLDRPLAADGRRIKVSLPYAVFSLVQFPQHVQAFVSGTNVGAYAEPPFAIALENALLKVQPVAILSASGPIVGNDVNSGTLALTLPLNSGVPTLPDPYAASFDAIFNEDFPRGSASAIATVAWAVPESSQLDFTLLVPDAQGGNQQPVGETFSRGRGLFRTFLLDLSSNADQFGVILPTPDVRFLSVDKLSLISPGNQVAVFTLPPISWEPMLTGLPTAVSGDIPLPPPPHDGGPAALLVESVHLVPVAPKPLVLDYVSEVQAQKRLRARLPLPYGIYADIDTSDMPFHAAGGVFKLNSPQFANQLNGGLQIRMEPVPKEPTPGMSPLFPGRAPTEKTNDYAQGVLSTNIFTAWNSIFEATSNGVPLERYDLSGYGASLFSDWRFTKAVGPAITQARFDVLVGRTSREVIQMQVVIDPWEPRAVRTITIDRQAGGWTLREDSGWQPASDGLFDFPSDKTGLPQIDPAFDAAHIHKGAIQGLVNIRNIQLDAPQFKLPGTGATYQPVLFDADVWLSNDVEIIAGGVTTAGRKLVPSRAIRGYILVDNVKYQSGSVFLPRPADGATIRLLLQTKGPAVAPVACTLGFGGQPNQPGLRKRVSQVDVSCDNAATLNLVCTARGTPELPRDGAWSTARKLPTSQAPSALDPNFPIPIVRPAPGVGGSDRWHLADPIDISLLGPNQTPTVLYGLLQATATQKIFFAQTQITNSPLPIQTARAPKLADVAALFNAAGIFPNLGDAFDFSSAKALSVSPDGISYDEVLTINKTEVMLMNFGIIQLFVEYKGEGGAQTHAEIHVNPNANPRWSIVLDRLCIAVRNGSNTLLSLYATVKADEHTAATIKDLNIRYGSFLRVLESIFNNLQYVARFLPGGKDAGLRVAFSQGKLTVRNAFALPKLPLGTGQITDIAVDMGFDIGLSPQTIEFVAGLGSSQKPFRWIVSPLAGTGVIQVGVNAKGLNVLVQAGIGLGLAIDLGIISGAASITIAVELSTKLEPFLLGVILSGRASVDVLSGLASVTITLAAGLAVVPPNILPSLPPPIPQKLGPYEITFIASVAVGIHITVAWVIDIDWDDYWQFKQTIETPAIPVPLP